MNKEAEILLELIKKSQFGSSDVINLDGVDIDALYEEALSQSVLGLIAPEIPSDYTNEKWLQAQYKSKASYIRYCHAEDELKELLDKNSIPFVILKGNAAAVSYKDPSRRSMGDIDFLVPQDMFDEAKNLLESSEYKFVKENVRHAGYIKNAIHFELHHHFSHEIDIESYLIYDLKTPVIAFVDGHEFPMLPELSNGIVLLDHMRSHLKGGMGLRQVIDWMMYVYRNLDDDFWNNEFKAIATEIGMDTLAITATRMCQLYLGLPENISWCKSADDVVCKELMDCIMVSGNFGRKNGQGSSIEKVSTSMKREGLFHWLQHAGEHNWNAYHKHHWLKPFCWFYQIFRYAKQGIKTGRSSKQIKGDLDRSKERYELLNKLNIC